MGRRGAALLLLSGVYIIMGTWLWLNGAVEVDPDQQILHLMLPLPIRVGKWYVAAAIAAWAATRRGPGRDWVGFAALSAVATIRAFSYAWAFGAWLLTEGARGYAFGWLAAVEWAGIGALILVLAGWAEVPRGFAPPRARHREVS